ncbi:MAG: hypothetical protein JW840_02575 [Candidatus Thermoplasmatota archaeon]|nr:hypothetical protein [Candidatus Thermoplasmatota archaeon]
MIWKTPIYRFRILLEEDSDDLKEIVFDVTGSAPPFIDVKDTMKGVFKKLLDSEEGKNINNILDFGAAKLRNTVHFLNEGKNVCAVEFEELSKKSDDAKKLLAICKSKTNFEKLIFPHPFIEHKKKYDLVLLINVLPVMPVFAERMMVLQLLHDKIKDKRYVLWYAQKEGSYKPIREKGEQNFGDGIWMGNNKRFKTFYKYHCVDDVNEMMALSGFNFVKKISAQGNDVLLYQKNSYNLFSGIVTMDKIIKAIPIDDTIEDPIDIQPKIVKMKDDVKEVIPNPCELSIEKLYAETLKKLTPGPDYAEEYHRLVSQIIYRIFRGSLRNMEIKQEMDHGMKIIDTVYTNSAEKGFFENLSKKFKIKCPYIILEAKNYSYDPENPEFDQLAGRLKDNIGKFGILVCRKIEDLSVAKERCEGYLDDGDKHIIFLTDEELLDLLELYQDNDLDSINDFMDKKIRPLIFKSKK